MLSAVDKQIELIEPLVRHMDETVRDGRRAADVQLAQLWREHREWGGRDRRFFGDVVFAFFRWRGWLADLLPARWTTALAAACWLDNLPHPAARALRARAGLGDLPAVNLPALADKARTLAARLEIASPWAPEQLVPPWVPDWLASPEDLGAATALAQCLDSFQSRPPLWLRLAPPAVPAALAWLNRTKHRAAVHPRLADALRVEGTVDLNGLWSAVGTVGAVQDLSSQSVGHVCAPTPGARWWDLCAGAGGKTLHLAALMQNRGALLATDVRPAALAELRRRANEAGITIVQTQPIDSLPPAPAEPFDGVLVDAPCSGLGTWNRNPDMRWRTDAATVDACAATQRQLLAQAAPCVRFGGALVYAVCTLTRAETLDVAADFLGRHPDYRPDPFPHPLTGRVTNGTAWVWPWDGPCSGMFMARLRRTARA